MDELLFEFSYFYDNSSLCSWLDHSVEFREILEHTRDCYCDISGIMHSSVDIISDCLDEIKCFLIEEKRKRYPLDFQEDPI